MNETAKDSEEQLDGGELVDDGERAEVPSEAVVDDGELAEVPSEDVPSEASPPQALSTETPKKAPALRPIEEWCMVHSTPDWLFAGLKIGKQWAIGQEVTEQVYLDAVAWAKSVECR